MESILDKLLSDRVFVQQKVFVRMASEHGICSIIAKCYDKVDVLRLIYTYNVNCINENWRFVVNFLFWILTTVVSSQHKIPVFDPLSGSWHACFSIFMLIFGDATISNIFQIWSSDFNRIQSPKKSTINKNILTQSFPIDSDHRWSDRATFLTRRDIPISITNWKQQEWIVLKSIIINKYNIYVLLMCLY